MFDLVIKDAEILDGSGAKPMHGDLGVTGGRIAAIGPNLIGPHDRVVEARGGFVLPGLIQTHIHLCQTLFRGYADDLSLMDWLRTRVWPMEAAHTPASLRAAARLATTELLCSGTTAVAGMSPRVRSPRIWLCT